MSLKLNRKTMMAGMFYKPNHVTYESCPVPVLEPGDMLVKVETALTCGTDIKCYRRGHPLLLKTFPSPFGHEFSGIVEEIAATHGETYINQFKPGDRVVCANSAPCYQCYYCKKRQTNLCENLNLLNGAYADYIRVPASVSQYNTYHIDDATPFSVAAFSEPLAVCLHGIAQADIQPSDTVAVIGLGPIGQLMVAACKLKGAHVTAMARTAHKLEMARQFGRADQLVNLSEQTSDSTIVEQFTPSGRGFDVVIEAVGRPEVWEKTLNLVRKGGTVNCFGGCPAGSHVTFDTRRLHYDEIRIVSSFHHTPLHMQAAVNLLNTKQLDPSLLISDTYPMAKFEEALQTVESGKAMKIALTNASF